MKQLHWLTGCVAALTLAGCNPANEAPAGEAPTVTTADVSEVGSEIAPFMALLETAFVQANGTEAELNGLLEALPAYAGIDWETMRFDEASGATVFTGLSFSIGSETPVGVRFDEASIWGLDSEFLAARIRGERLDESAPLMTRFDGRALSAFGVGEYMSSAITGLIDTIVVAEGEDLPDDFGIGFDNLEITADRVLMTDVSLLPWEYTPLSEDVLQNLLDDEPEIKELVMISAKYTQQAVAGFRTLAYDKSVTTNLSFGADIDAPGEVSRMQETTALAAASGARGFDLDLSLTSDVNSLEITEYVAFDMGDDEFGDVFDNMSPSGLPVGTSIKQEITYALAKSENIRLDKAMGYFARGELPSMDERDLISLGRSSVTDFGLKLNDGQAFSASAITLNAAEFEWLIPSRIDLSLDDAVLNVSESSAFAKGIFEAFAKTASEDMNEADAEETMLILEKKLN